MRRPARPGRDRGFSLFEVMVTLVVLGVGLLGIAKMQALALSSTGVAALRSLAALEASSLAASMRADRAYWAQGGVAPPPTGITVIGTAISDPVLAAPADCTTTGGVNPPNCAPAKLAAYDLQRWAAVVNGLLPGAASRIICSTTVNAPVDCTIQISWGENAVALFQQGTSTVGATFNVPTYTLYVEP